MLTLIWSGSTLPTFLWRWSRLIQLPRDGDTCHCAVQVSKGYSVFPSIQYLKRSTTKSLISSCFTHLILSTSILVSPHLCMFSTHRVPGQVVRPRAQYLRPGQAMTRLFLLWRCQYTTLFPCTCKPRDMEHRHRWKYLSVVLHWYQKDNFIPLKQRNSLLFQPKLQCVTFIVPQATATIVPSVPQQLSAPSINLKGKLSLGC